jgi:hypothetical protein
MANPPDKNRQMREVAKAKERASPYAPKPKPKRKKKR